MSDADSSPVFDSLAENYDATVPQTNVATTEEVEKLNEEATSEDVAEFEYDGPEGEFGTADEAEVDDTQVAEDDESWGV